MIRILVVDDEPRGAELLRRELADRGHAVEAFSSSQAALARLAEAPFDLVITDLRMPAPDGLALLAEIRRRWPGVEVILMTAHGDETTAVKAMRAGAFDYLKKDPRVEPEEIEVRIERLLESRRGRAERDRLAREVAALRTGTLAVIGRSDPLAHAGALAKKVAATDATVLLRGESGTGKDLFARAIHFDSPRSAGPWVKVNCGAIPETLLESELFGHEKGAFTGASVRKLGRFEQADGGTIFLDEIGELSLPLQVKLLQVLEEKAFVRVGGNETRAVNVRILAATNRDLEGEVAAGRFREDLFYRLNVFPIVLPPLRERPGDLEPLVHHFLAAAGAPPGKITPEGYRALASYPFPGNVRELAHVIERALIIAGGDPITPDELLFQPARRLPAAGAVGGPVAAAGFLTGGFVVPEIPDAGLSLEALERALLLQALEKAKGNKSAAARLLGLTRRTLYSRLEKHGLGLGGDAAEAGEAADAAEERS